MKRCPFCNREFKDSLIYCVVDGHELEAGISQQEADDAQSLSDLLNTEAPMDVERAARIAISICDSLEDLHRAGRTMGDLRPQQIFIADSDQSPIVRITHKETSAGQKAIAYLSPEAAQRQKTDATSDVYSVGTILYEMLTGQLPFKASSPAALIVKQLLERPQLPRDLRPEISVKLQEVVLRAIEKERSARQQSIRQLKQELEDAAFRAAIQSKPSVSDMIGAAPPTASVTLASQPSYSSAPPPAVMMPLSPAAQATAQAPTGSFKVSSPSASSKKLIPAILIGLCIVAALAAVFVLNSRQSASRDSQPTNSSPRETPNAAPPKSTPSDNTRPSPSQGPPPQATPPRPGNSNTTAPAPEGNANSIIWIVLGIALAGAAVAVTLLLLRRKSVASEKRFGPAQPAQTPWPVSREAYPTPQSWPPQIARESNDTAETVKTPIHGKPDLRESIKRCPACQTEFPITGQFCVYDGNSLREEVKITPPKESPSFYDLQSVETKKRCPRCDADYPVTTTFCHTDGQRLIEISPVPKPIKQTSEIAPFIIGQYRCFARLGEGGMGMVYKAYHVHLQRLSAVKVLLPQTAIIPDAVRMFRREAQLASSINHPNSVIIYDYGELDADLFYLAMEFIPGRSLANIINPEDQQPRPMPLARALSITRQICDALDTAHQLGIIHRDLKPQNVMISERSNRPDLVKVVDFGIARSMAVPSEYETMPGTVMGTPAYMSPEQARGDVALDARSDVYSLGVMLYQMLSGVLPFQVKGLSLWQQVNQRATLNSPPPLLSEFYPRLNIPFGVDQVLTRALETDRNRRIQSVVEFLDQLEQAARSESEF